MYHELLDQGIDPDDYDDPTPEDVAAFEAEKAYWEALYAQHALPGERFSDFQQRVEDEHDSQNLEAI